MPLLKSRMSFFVIVILFSLITKEAYLQEKVMEVGEELKYELSFGFIKLGYIKFILSNSHKDGKKTVYNSKLEIKSYPEVPFIKVNQIFESEMKYSENELASLKFFETSFKEKSITRTDYKFNLKKNVVKVLKETDGNIEKNSDIQVKKNVLYRDELSWQYESRLNSFSNKNYNIPVFAGEEESSVRYSFNANKTVVNIENCPYDISVLKLEGISDFTGFFGFKGEFLILLSDDEYRVPVKAYFNSSLGNIVCELISYKKKSWKPPAFSK
ncbi:MAG TPA: DUF3108 domain-containing protein [Ignavibacteria bacterium]|nr:DUF3108 domain-containing protein [Ignavibacteria bacterium]